MKALDMKSPAYAPGKFLDALKEMLGLKNDAALSRALAFPAVIISKVRSGLLPINSVILISAHEETGLTIAELRKLAEA